MNSEGTDLGKYPSLGLGNSFSFKFEHPKGRVHRFNFGKCTPGVSFAWKLGQHFK